jgi:hypothetical protein
MFPKNVPRERMKTRRDARAGHGEGISMLALIAASGATATVLWVIAAILVIAGIVSIIRGAVVAGVVLIVVGLLVGPGGVSIFA